MTPENAFDADYQVYLTATTERSLERTTLGLFQDDAPEYST